jgi:hypothetical protein
VAIETKPIKIMDGVKSVSAGGGHTAVIKNDGSLWLWGNNGSGQLGDGTKESNPMPAQAAIHDVVSVYAGGQTTFVIKADNTLWHCGNTDFRAFHNSSQPWFEKKMEDVAMISESEDGLSHLIIKTDSSLWAWGDNFDGKLGIAGISEIMEPTKVMDGVKYASVGGYQSLVIMADGSLWAMGNPKNSTTPTAEDAKPKILTKSNILTAATASLYALFLDDLGTAWLMEGKEGRTTWGEEILPVQAMRSVKIPPMRLIDAANPAEPSAWAKAEVEEALALGVVYDKHDITKSWRSTATRRDAAVVFGQVIEQIVAPGSSGALSVIAEERGWEIFDHSADFADVSADASPGSYEIIFFKHAGVVSGVGRNKYEPDGAYTRAQAVAMIGRIAEVFFGKQAVGANPFSDVPSWAAPYVGYAAEAGITGGIGDGKFGGDNPLTNEQLAIFALRAYKAWK